MRSGPTLSVLLLVSTMSLAVPLDTFGYVENPTVEDELLKPGYKVQAAGLSSVVRRSSAIEDELLKTTSQLGGRGSAVEDELLKTKSQLQERDSAKEDELLKTSMQKLQDN
ncbi:hypothetical protein BHYA_0149g00210 [Botrytis hyacinthi]|uniref:Uncharacterized protein n=1 Tax=Botrytis hyacinthi TaxID=278943 RepID=A0A4Z1GHR2_9HELO|nr:hypothetical protein BHYA_0149g00210 [Botrytis hyacinthi]